MSDARPVTDGEPRPLLFALWFRTLVALLGAAVVAVLVIPPVLHLAGATMFETVAVSASDRAVEPAGAHALLAILANPLTLAGLGLLTGTGLGWLAREGLRPSPQELPTEDLVLTVPELPLADNGRLRLDDCAAIARKFVEDIEPLLAMLGRPSPAAAHNGLSPMPEVMSRPRSPILGGPKSSPLDRDAI
jgi:hypothetical protein